jgi:hypothetical protein
MNEIQSLSQCFLRIGYSTRPTDRYEALVFQRTSSLHNARTTTLVRATILA